MQQRAWTTHAILAVAVGVVVALFGVVIFFGSLIEAAEPTASTHIGWGEFVVWTFLCAVPCLAIAAAFFIGAFRSAHHHHLRSAQHAVLDAAERCGGVLTAVQYAQMAGLSMDELKRALDAFYHAAYGACDVQVAMMVRWSTSSVACRGLG